MATSSQNTISAFQKSLDPFIKPREQVNYIRRILALELGSYIGDTPIQQPLPLNDGLVIKDIGPELKGLYKEYIEALQKNHVAHRDFEQIASELTSTPRALPKPAGKDASSSQSLLEEHVTLLKLRKKREILVTIQRHLDHLQETPAAGRDAVDIEQVLKGGMAQPSVPASVINSFVVEQSAGQPDLDTRANQLDKTVLRTKLLLKHDERLLAEAKARCTTKPEMVSNGAKLQALNNTRNELIGWIETELSKASEQGDEAIANPGQETDRAAITNQLQEIHTKYEEYVAARAKTLKLASQTSQSSLPPPDTTPAQPTANSLEPEAPSTDYLVTPYIDALLTQSRLQKALITHKSHITTSLHRQNQESCHLLGRLAEESQLLSAYPMKDSARRRSGIPEIIAAKPTERPDMAGRIRPWIFAADAAKIGTLEAVAEKVEDGQVALENSMATLHEMDVLLGLDEEWEEKNEVDTTEDDLWLQGPEANKQPMRKKKALPSANKGDPWSKIHGNLGLIGHDNAP
jgi:hypothetical protein